MTIKTESKLITIALRLYRGGWDAGYEPDCFADMDSGSFAREFGKGIDDETGAILASDADTKDLVSWWQDECDTANRGEDGDCLIALAEDEIDRGDEWTLFVDEENM